VTALCTYNIHVYDVPICQTVMTANDRYVIQL